MKQYLMLKASVFALATALGFTASLGLAQDGSYSDTYSTPRDTTQESDVQQQAPSDVTPPPPASMDEGSSEQTQPRGARGPVRSSEMTSDRAFSSSDKGYSGFLNWQQTNTNTP